MFGSWLDRNERQLRLQKSKIYKQMLDNQILLNQQYRRKEQEQENSRERSNGNKNISLEKKRHSHQFSRDSQKQAPYEVKKMKLPILQDKQTLIEGLSNFITPEKTPKTKKKNISRIRTQEKTAADEAEDQSQDQDIEQILSELKTLNKEIVKSKQQIRHKRLSSFGGATRRNYRQRQRRMNIDNKYNSANDADQTHLEVDPVTRTPKNARLSLSPIDSMRNKSLAVNKTDKSPQQSALEPFSHSFTTNHQQSQGVNQKSDNHDLIQKERERFIQILKKVKNRGECLFIKLSKFPKEAKQ